MDLHNKFKSAKEFYNNWQIEDALEIFQECVSKEPKNPVFNLFLGSLLLDIGRYSESKTYLQQALTKINSDDDVKAKFKLAELYRRISHKCPHYDDKQYYLQKSLSLYSSLVKSDNCDLKIILECAITNRLIGNYDQAKELFLQVLEDKEYHDAAFYHLARIALTTGELKELEHLKKNLFLLDSEYRFLWNTKNKYPDYIFHLLLKGFSFLKNYDYCKAKKCFQEAIKYDNFSAISYLKLGDIEFLDGNYESALENFNRALSYEFEFQPNPNHIYFHDHAVSYDLVFHYALAHKVQCLELMGRDCDIGPIVDYKKDINFEQMITPKGYKSIEDFCISLKEEILSSPKLKNTGGVIGDRSTFEIHKGSSPLLNLCLEQVKKMIQLYINRINPITGHPFYGRIPMCKFELLKATVCAIHPNSYHEPHFHPNCNSNWLSVVFYVDYPEMDQPDVKNQGIIEFGGSEFSSDIDRKLTTRYSIQPKTGHIIMFPSYFVHRTKTFKSKSHRLAVVFEFLTDKPF
jgi:tetratricopeptide (TPR) repeat protein